MQARSKIDRRMKEKTAPRPAAMANKISDGGDERAKKCPGVREMLTPAYSIMGQDGADNRRENIRRGHRTPPA